MAAVRVYRKFDTCVQQLPEKRSATQKHRAKLPEQLTLQELPVLLVLQLRDALVSKALQLLQRTLAAADALWRDAAAGWAGRWSSFLGDWSG